MIFSCSFFKQILFFFRLGFGCRCLLAFTLFIAPFKQSHSASSPYINVGKAQIKQTPLALVPLVPLDEFSMTSRSLKYGKLLYEVIKKDLTISSYFIFISEKAFIEDYKKYSIRPREEDPVRGFGFSSWKEMGVELLIRIGFKVYKNQIFYEASLYHVPQKKLILRKTSKGSVDKLRNMGHQFCNDVIKVLTGRKGFFTTQFVVARSTRGFQKEIFIMDWDGANQRKITKHRTISQSPSWSPKGRYILYTAYVYHKREKMRNADLFVYDRVTGRRRLVSYHKGINSGGVFAPDSGTVFLRISKSGASDIYEIDLINLKTRQITNGPRGAMNVEPGVSPDGKTIVFSSDRSGRPMIYKMDRKSQKTKRLTYAGVYNSTPAWSPDGQLLAFSGFDKGHFDIFTIDVQGKNIKRLTTSYKKNGKMANNENPSFSPDGRFILFSSDRTGNYQLYIISIDGKHEYRLTFDKKNYYKPQWSPYLD